MYIYIAMERTQIYLTRDAAAALDEIAAERGVTRSHLIREAIDATYLAPRASQRDRLLSILEELGPPWQGRTDLPDGEAYQRQARGGGVASAPSPPAPTPRHRAGATRRARRDQTRP